MAISLTGRLLPGTLNGGPVTDDQFHRLQDLSAAVVLGNPAGDQEPFVDVVVEDGAALPEVLAAERYGYNFHNGVADEVGVTRSLAFNDFNTFFRD